MAKKKKYDFKTYLKEHKFKLAFYGSLLLWFVLFITVLGDVNFRTWLVARSDIRKQEALMVKYQNEIDSLKREVLLLTQNKDSLERFARENFKYSNPDEDVFIISDELMSKGE